MGMMDVTGCLRRDGEAGALEMDRDIVSAGEARVGGYLKLQESQYGRETRETAISCTVCVVDEACIGRWSRLSGDKYPHGEIWATVRCVESRVYPCLCLDVYFRLLHGNV